MVEVDENWELETCEVESDIFTTVCEALRQSSILFSGNEMLELWRGMTRKRSNSEQYIGPGNKKKHVPSLPPAAHATTKNEEQEDVALK